MTARRSIAAPILAVLAVVLPFAVYVGGYFGLSERIGIGGSGPLDGQQNIRHYFRVYPSPWQATTFKPLAAVESWCSGIPVYTMDREEWGFSDGEPP